MLHSDKFPEGRENVVRLPEGDARSFAVFAEYVYVGYECDTGATMGDTDNEETNMPNSCVPGTGEGEEDNYDTDVEVSDEDKVVHDHYSFPFLVMCWEINYKYPDSSVILWRRYGAMENSAIRLILQLDISNMCTTTQSPKMVL